MITATPVDIQAQVADARAAVASVVLPLVANAVGTHRRALAGMDWQDDLDEFDRTFRRWAVESGAGELRALLDEVVLMVGSADDPDSVGEPALNARLAHVHGGTCP